MQEGTLQLDCGIDCRRGLSWPGSGLLTRESGQQDKNGKDKAS